MKQDTSASNKTHQACPICGDTSLVKLPRYNSAHLVRCGKCKMVFSINIPTEAELHAHYANYTRARHVSPLTIQKYHVLLKEFSNYNQGNRILDVGCGSGFFVEEAQGKGWESTGTEFGADAVEFCRAKSLNVLEGSVESIGFPDNHFDVITSFEVIEHLSYPLPHMTELHRILRPGGLLYMTTPNFGSITRILLKEGWNLITYPEHLSYFDSWSLDSALKNAGFKRKKLIADGISVDRLRNSIKKKKVISENTAPEKQAKKRVFTNEGIRRASEKNGFIKILRRSIDGSLNVFGIGEFLKGYYEKPKPEM